MYNRNKLKFALPIEIRRAKVTNYFWINKTDHIGTD